MDDGVRKSVKEGYLFCHLKASKEGEVKVAEGFLHGYDLVLVECLVYLWVIS